MDRSAPRTSTGATGLVALALLFSTGTLVHAADTTFKVDPHLGNSAFTAVFDATVGERITAVSSQIGCTIDVDEANLVGHARCSVPLTSIAVDGDETKSDHFAQWATNKKIEPEKCTFDLDVPRVALKPPVDTKQPVPFATEGTFTVCGRTRDDHGKEKISGTIVYLPPGTYGPARTLRVRARIEGFDRERYGISPKNTAGWLARVQQLADVVAVQGTIDVNAFATAPAAAGDRKAE
jgi:hypothetical protein